MHAPVVHLLLAAFFLRLPSSPVTALERQGGARVQESAVSVNGLDGTLSVYAFERTAADIESALDTPPTPGSGAFSLFLLPCGAPESPQCLALLFETRAKEPGTPQWPWADLPMPSGFTPTFSATLNEERTGFAAGDTDLSLPAWTAHLAAHGWTAVSPAAGATRLALFAKGSETLVLTHLGTRASILRRAPR